MWEIKKKPLKASANDFLCFISTVHSSYRKPNPKHTLSINTLHSLTSVSKTSISNATGQEAGGAKLKLSSSPQFR